MKRLYICTVSLLLLTGLSGAAELCTELKATGIGLFAPKYPKAGAQGTCSDGVYTMLAYGHDYYWAWDRGGFSYVVVRGSADFSFSARLVDANISDVRSEKVGICVREGLNGNERAVQLRWDGFFMGSESNAQISWLYRFMPGTAASEFCSDANRSSCFQEGGSGVTEANGSTLKISRVAGKYKLFVNDQPVADDKTMALGGDSVLVGLIASFGGGDNPATRMVKFDNITCTGCGASSAVRLDAAKRSPATWSFVRSGSSVALVGQSETIAKIRSVSLYNASGKLVSRNGFSRESNGLIFDSRTEIGNGLLVAAVELTSGRTETVRCNLSR